MNDLKEKIIRTPLNPDITYSDDPLRMMRAVRFASQLNFEIEKNSLESKSIILKELWKIILSDDNVDEYESNLMRRICGLIYFPDKESGEIQMRLKKQK